MFYNIVKCLVWSSCKLAYNLITTGGIVIVCRWDWNFWITYLSRIAFAALLAHHVYTQTYYFMRRKRITNLALKWLCVQLSRERSCASCVTWRLPWPKQWAGLCNLLLSFFLFSSSSGFVGVENNFSSNRKGRLPASRILRRRVFQEKSDSSGPRICLPRFTSL